MNLKSLCSCTRWQAQCGRCVNCMKYMDLTLNLFWYMSPTFLQTVTCELMSSWDWDGLYNRNYRTFLTVRWALAWRLEKLCVQTQQLLSQTIQGDRLIQGLADSSEEDAHGQRSPWPHRMFCYKANLLRFKTHSNTCTHFNLQCCSSSLFQSAVVLIVSPWWSQLPLLPEERCASLNEENKPDTIG